MADHTTTDAVTRRNVLKTTGGLLAGSTMLAGLGAGRGATESEEGLWFEVEEATKEVIIARVSLSVEIRKMILPDGEIYVPFGRTFLGHRDHFTVEDDTVSLPEDTDGLVNPVEAERLDEQTYRMYFRTEDIDWPAPDNFESEEVTLGLGIFTERTVSRDQWDTYGPVAMGWGLGVNQ